MTALSRTASLAALLALATAGCGGFIEVPIETPIRAKLDVSPFSRVLVVGFVAGGDDEVDANLETVRLLRSQLRSKSDLNVIDADPLSLLEVARQEAPSPVGSSDAGSTLPDVIKTEEDLEAYEQLFANVDYWKQIGEEYQNPLIVTGTILFSPESRSQIIQRERETFDAFGRRQVQPVRTFEDRDGFLLEQKFIFIDGRSGVTMHSERFREERLYSRSQNMPALSSYFDLMDGIIPRFLNALSTQKVRGMRILLQ